MMTTGAPADPDAAFLEAPPLPPFLADLYPFPRRRFRLPGAAGHLHFLDAGEPGARPVLLVHGNPTWSFLWRRVVADLGGGLRAVAPDLLGFGLSDTLRLSAHTLDRHTDAVAALVEALDLEGLILVGQDWGGPIAAGVGARLPERIAGLVLANTAVALPRHPRGTAFHRFARLPGLSDLVFRGLGFPQVVLHRVQGDRASIRGAVARGYRWPLRGWRRRAAPLALARMVPDGPGHPSLPALRRAEAWAVGFAGPVSLVWGRRDPILGRGLARHQRSFPAAPAWRTDAGHFLQEEVPGLVAAVIRDTVDRLDR